MRSGTKGDLFSRTKTHGTALVASQAHPLLMSYARQLVESGSYTRVEIRSATEVIVH